MGSLEETYDQLVAHLAARQMAHLVEPFAHVQEVERLRRFYRPRGDIRLLLVAESHVRTSDIDYQHKGVQFIYEHRYYAPWWSSLMLPGFGAHIEKYRNTPHKEKTELRKMYLERLQQSGFWLLDASIVALSGYKNVGQTTSRPFFLPDMERMLTLSWAGYVKDWFDQAISQSKQPVIVLFDNVARVLPPELRRGAHIVKFLVASNSRKYSDPQYLFGTHAFASAARKAGVHACLGDL